MESMQLLREATREGHAAVVSGTVATIYRSHGGLHNADTHGAFETTVVLNLHISPSFYSTPMAQE